MNLNQTAFESEDYKKEGALINLHLLPINKALVVRRAFDGLSQMELSAQLGIGQTALSRIEQGKLAIGERLIPLVKKYVYKEEFELDGL